MSRLRPLDLRSPRPAQRCPAQRCYVPLGWLGAIALGLCPPPVGAESRSTPEQPSEPCVCTCATGDAGATPEEEEPAIAPALQRLPRPAPVYCLTLWPTPGTGSLNFQTDLTLAETLAFYREELEALGFQERQINTVVTDTVFSVVFDGWPQEGALVVQSVVVQSVDLGHRVNVNLRFEAL